jgi:hypothetical protein
MIETTNTADKSNGTMLINEATPVGKLDKSNAPRTLTKTSNAMTPIIASIEECRIAIITPPKQTKKPKNLKTKLKPNANI